MGYDQRPGCYGSSDWSWVAFNHDLMNINFPSSGHSPLIGLNPATPVNFELGYIVLMHTC